MGIGAWETPPSPVIGIGIPHTGLCFVEWAMYFKNLILLPNTQVFLNRGFPIDQARNKLVQQAQQAKCDFLFFLDSDTLPPPETIQILLSNNLPIVSGVYRNKRDGLPAAWRQSEAILPKKGYLPINKYDGMLTMVDVVGAGCLLVNMKVFEILKYPWFEWTMDLDMVEGTGEDFNFCEKARAAGFHIWLDNRVRCGHEDLASLEPGNNPLTRCKL